MKKLLLLAVCIAMAYGCSQSDFLTEPGLIQSSTKSVQRVAGLLQINAGGGTVQAHVSLNPAIPLYLDVYITVHNINIDFGGGSGTTYGSATLITMLGYSGNAYSEVLNGSATSHSYVDVNSLKIRPDVPDLYHIEWTVTGLPYEDPDPPFPINPGGGGGGDGCDTLCLVVTSPYFHIPANNGKI